MIHAAVRQLLLEFVAGVFDALASGLNVVDANAGVAKAAVRLLAAWLGDRRDLCVVGDVSQAIYGFAGADASFLEEFDRHFPGGEHITLHYNCRSTPQVVRAAAAVLGRILVEAIVGLDASLPDGLITVVPVPLHAKKRAQALHRPGRAGHWDRPRRLPTRGWR